MIDWRRKLTSRKFWACIADFVGMLLIALHVADETATQVTALIMAGAGVVAYILGEAITDTGDNITIVEGAEDQEEPGNE